MREEHTAEVPRSPAMPAPGLARARMGECRPGNIDHLAFAVRVSAAISSKVSSIFTEAFGSSRMVPSQASWLPRSGCR